PHSHHARPVHPDRPRIRPVRGAAVSVRETPRLRPRLRVLHHRSGDRSSAGGRGHLDRLRTPAAPRRRGTLMISPANMPPRKPNPAALPPPPPRPDSATPTGTSASAAPPDTLAADAPTSEQSVGEPNHAAPQQHQKDRPKRPAGERTRDTRVET